MHFSYRLHHIDDVIDAFLVVHFIDDPEKRPIKKTCSSPCSLEPASVGLVSPILHLSVFFEA